jgi:RND family efflux transporter MFP subunit
MILPKFPDLSLRKILTIRFPFFILFKKIFFLLTIFPVFLSGCSFDSSAQKLQETGDTYSNSESNIISVKTETAQLASLEPVREYIGNTQPLQEVSLRSQVEGRLLELEVDVGDRVKKGQILAKLDDSLLAAEVNEAQAELVARESELARARAEVNNAYQHLERAKIELKQAENDAKRANSLLEEGAISRQSAELSQTNAQVARQTVLSAQKQIKIEQQAVAVALGRIGVQKAVIAQEKQRQAYSSLIAPINGIAIEKSNEPGDLINPGEDVLKIGDFSKVKVIVPVSDLDLAKIKIGQSATVKIDGFPQQDFTGLVTRISPLANRDTLKIDIEVTISNPEEKIGRSLLARVTFQTNKQNKIIIPESAINQKDNKTTVFIVKNNQQNEQKFVEEREVILGNQALGKVEIISGLTVGEKFVVDRAKPLKNNQQVKLSILSK